MGSDTRGISSINGRNGWVWFVVAAIAIAALIYLAGPEVTQISPSQLIGP